MRHATSKPRDDEEQDREPRQQYDSLDDIGPGHRTHATECLVDHHDRRQADDPVLRRHPAIGDTLHGGTHRLQLGQGVVAQSVDHQHRRQQRQHRRAEAMPDIIPGRDEIGLAGDRHEPRRKQQITDDDGEHEQHRDGPLEADAIGLSGVAKHRIAAVLRCIERQQQNRETHGPTRQIEVDHAVALPTYAAEPADPDHRYQIQSDQCQGPGAETKSGQIHQSFPPSSQ